MNSGIGNNHPAVRKVPEATLSGRERRRGPGVLNETFGSSRISLLYVGVQQPSVCRAICPW
ncbi:hypothetical protein AGR1B_Lc70014 [Agrobacterium fabacearum S56]|nr:hypothetical protein AGR1B_Lc70014 [Agrobacterium fabacearum S56]